MESFWSSKPVQIGIAIAAAIVIQFVSRFVIRKLVRHSVPRRRGQTELDKEKREKTIITIVGTTIGALIWMLTVFNILTILGVNVAALLTGAGIIGVFAGLSAQNTIKDFLGGTFILFEQQFRVGDKIKMAGGSVGNDGIVGVVEEITLRITKLRDADGHVVIIRNGEPTVVTNLSLEKPIQKPKKSARTKRRTR